MGYEQFDGSGLVNKNCSSKEKNYRQEDVKQGCCGRVNLPWVRSEPKSEALIPTR